MSVHWSLNSINLLNCLCICLLVSLFLLRLFFLELSKLDLLCNLNSSFDITSYVPDCRFIKLFADLEETHVCLNLGFDVKEHSQSRLITVNFLLASPFKLVFYGFYSLLDGLLILHELIVVIRCGALDVVLLLPGAHGSSIEF